MQMLAAIHQMATAVLQQAAARGAFALPWSGADRGAPAPMHGFPGTSAATAPPFNTTPNGWVATFHPVTPGLSPLHPILNAFQPSLWLHAASWPMAHPAAPSCPGGPWLHSSPGCW
jgi:hypothetical protein